jgi:hypothetical protein
MSNKQISKESLEKKEVQLKVCTWKRLIKTLKKTFQCF